MALSGKAFQRGELANLQAAYAAILSEVAGKTFEFDVVDILNGAAPHVVDLSNTKLGAEKEFKKIFGSQSGVMNSPNLTTYFELMSRLEGFYRQTDCTSVTLVFDSSRQFNSGFANLYQRISTLQPRILAFPGKTPLIFGFTHIKSFRDEVSNGNILLQLADLLASSLNSLFLKIGQHDSATSFSNFETFMIALTYQLLDNKIGDWILSDRMKHLFGQVFVAEGERLGREQQLRNPN
jgi:hypothetical protein